MVALQKRFLECGAVPSKGLIIYQMIYLRDKMICSQLENNNNECIGNPHDTAAAGIADPNTNLTTSSFIRIPGAQFDCGPSRWGTKMRDGGNRWSLPMFD